MRVNITRKDTKVHPDPRRVIARFFFNGEERTISLIQKVMKLSNDQVQSILMPLLQDFSQRHRSISRKFAQHYNRIVKYIIAAGFDPEKIDNNRKLLLGAYFTHEYSIESAAFFNPSMVEDVDQSNLQEGELRVIISFRAVGEGHISSVVFRRGILSNENDIRIMPAGSYIEEAETIHSAIYQKKLFLKKAIENGVNREFLQTVEENLGSQFDYEELKKLLIVARNNTSNEEHLKHYKRIMALSDSYRKIIFSKDTDISDRVIFPISDLEKNGIEDARFVKFVRDNGSVVYYATYTAYDGSHIMPKLLKTADFYEFKTSPLNGEGAANKNLALFPRKINGKYAMLSRIDGWNNYIMYSDNINIWDDPMIIQAPDYPWEFVQVGNCGSPLETNAGWLVITHAVGPMRKYCISACLLDIEDPSKEIGRLSEPLIMPNSDEREGYVPNVVYSCGSLIHNGEVIIPYGMSDERAGFVTVNLESLLERLTSSI